MKKILALILAFTMLIGCSAVASADGDSIITVIGTATVSVPADFAIVTLGVTTMDEDVQKSAGLNAEKIDAVIFALKELGIPEDDISTAYYYMETIYDYNTTDGAGYAIRGYQVNNSVTVTVRALELVGQVVDTALRAGANQVNGVSFQSTQAGSACDEALQAAIKEASRKAALMAEAAGVKLGAMVSVTENYGSYGGVSMKAEAAADMAPRSTANTRFLADGLNCTATVTVAFEIEK